MKMRKVLYEIEKYENVICYLQIMQYIMLTFSAWQTKTDTCANSVDPDEMARNEPSHLDVHCLTFCF